AADHRLRQHRLRLSLLPAARLANPRAAREARLLEDRAVHAGLLDDDVAGRLARGLAALAHAASLGEDAAPAAGARRGRRLTYFSSFGPAPTIFGSGLPIASMSRPA